jgi:hypothetical protein
MPAVSGDIQYIGTSVLDATQLAGVDATALHDGDLAFLTGTKKFYHLDRSSVAAPDGVLVIATKSGVGRWLIGPNATDVSADGKKFSALLVGAAGATFGYAADVPNAIATNPIGYPLETPAVAVRIEIDILAGNNTFTVASTTFTVYKSGVVTAVSVTFAAGEVGQKSSTVLLAFLATDTFDLRADNPGNAADAGKIIAFSGEISLY